MTEDRDVAENTTDLVRRYAEKASLIYETRTAGDYTWAGLLYHFLDVYRKQVEKSWADIMETNAVALWQPREAEPMPNPTALYESPLIEVERQYAEDARGQQAFHEMTKITVTLFPGQEESFWALLEQEFGRIT